MRNRRLKIFLASFCMFASFVAMLSISTTCLAASLPNVKDRGVFVFTMAGKQLGSESFEIRMQKGQIEAESKVELHLEQDGKPVEFKTTPKLVLSPDLKAQTYQWTQHGAQSSHLEMDLSSTPAQIRYKTVSGGDDVRDFELPQDVTILDSNVIHHYQIVLLRFRLAGGGKQTFSAFVPQDALPGTLNVEEKGEEQTDVGGRSEKLRHLVVTTDNAQIDLWADEKDHLQKVAIPAVQLEVIRKK